MRADQMTFLNETKPETSSDCILSKEPKENFGKPFAPVFLFKEDIKSLIDFSKKTSKKMLFGLNLNVRDEDGSWNSTNAELLLEFFREQNFFPDFELGNEPNSYPHHFNYTMAPEQQASDFVKLQKILVQKGFNSSKLIGPSTTGRGPTALSYFSRFLKEQPPIAFSAYHHYTLNGHLSAVADFLNPSSFFAYANESKIWSETARRFKTTPLISEGALAFGGGAKNISDRFVSSFLWADKLAMSAKAGIRAFCRETAFGGAYALVNSKMHPTPSYWVSFYFRQFFHGHILSMQTSNTPDAFHRIYTFCSKDNK
jgi:heparanase 1